MWQSSKLCFSDLVKIHVCLSCVQQSPFSTDALKNLIFNSPPRSDSRIELNLTYLVGAITAVKENFKC